MKVAGGNNVALTAAISVVATIENSLLCCVLERSRTLVLTRPIYWKPASRQCKHYHTYDDKPCGRKRFDAWASRASA